MKSNLQKIDHVVVLMLENRSFDNMLGFLVASPGSRQKVNGVYRKALKNPIPKYAQPCDGTRFVPVGIETSMTNPNPDPGEEYAHVNTQLFGRVIPEENRDRAFDAKPSKPYNLPNRKSYTNAPMNGFVTDYVDHLHAVTGMVPNYKEYSVIMNCHTEEQLPILSTLAKQYAVFDNWFASVPSQTLCNRSFMHTGTSQGYVLNSPFYHWLWHDTPTIFNRMEERQHCGITWKVYFDKLDIVSLTGLQHRRLWKYRNTNFFHIEDFEKDAADGRLPSYAFIEPRLLLDHNDQHPPVDKYFETSSVLAGELLIKRIYEALRHGKGWERTLFIITFDEHGGCYDHVPPPAAVPPDPKKPRGEQDFRFDRLGVRVPTVMISPYIKKGTVNSDVHDHTSILKFLCDRWNLEPLTERDKHANPFDKVLNLKIPRHDTFPLHANEYKIPRNALDEPLNDLQRTVLLIMAGFENALEFSEDKHIVDQAQELLEAIIDDVRIARIKTVGQAIHFAIAFDQRVTKHHPFFRALWMKIKFLLRSIP